MNKSENIHITVVDFQDFFNGANFFIVQDSHKFK
jgi:hypothetical protein